MLVIAGGGVRAETASDPDALFRKAFGQRVKTKLDVVTVPMRVDGVVLGEVEIKLADDPEAISFSSDVFLRLTSELLTDAAYAAVASRVQDGRLAFGDLRRAGLSPEYDQNNLRFDLVVGFDLRKTVAITVANTRGTPDGKKVIEPAKVSAYANISGTVSSDNKAGTQRESVTIDGAINIHNVILEYQGFLNAEPQTGFSARRGDLRLVYHMPESLITYQAGDVVYRTVGMQRYRKLAGFVVEKNEALDPYRVLTPLNEQEFVVQSPSTAEIYLNGARLGTLRLAPNRYNIRDFPLAQGTNDVRLVVTDDYGRVQEFDYSLFGARSLVASGVSLWSFSAGVPQLSGAGYNYGGPFGVTGYYRQGVSDALTLGGYLQADSRQQIYGVEGVWATGFGTIQFDTVLSDTQGIGAGWASEIRYNLFDARADNRAAQQRWEAYFQSFSKRYAPWGAIDQENSIALDTGVRLSQLITPDIYLTVSLGFEKGRGQRGDAGTGAITANARLADRWRLSATLQGRVGEAKDVSALVGVSLAFPQTHARSRTSFNTKNDELRTSYYRRSPDGRWYGRAEAATMNGGQALAGELDYTGNQFRANIRHDELLGNGDSSVSVASAASAIVFADGYFGVSRPVQRSYAIIVPHESLKGGLVGVNKSRYGYQAASGLGPAVLPALTPYTYTKINIDLPDAPAASDLGETEPILHPTDRSGTIVHVGAEPTITIMGTLHDAEGKPLALRQGNVPGHDGLEFFTNRGGRFVLAGLRPGQYTLVANGLTFLVNVAGDPANIAQIGDIRPINR